MARMRIVAVTLATTVAIGALALSGCNNARESGRNLRTGYVEEPTTGEMVADGVSRPMTLWATAIGAMGWIVTLPFTIPSGSAGDTAKAWVADPFKYTFCRPMGHMEDRPDEPCIEKDQQVSDNVKR